MNDGVNLCWRTQIFAGNAGIPHFVFHKIDLELKKILLAYGLSSPSTRTTIAATSPRVMVA
jgi:hypothetical protein